jgi:hypothetical protein
LFFSQPLSAEASADPVKKQDGLALRLLPLHSMLAYTLVSTPSLIVKHIAFWGGCDGCVLNTCTVSPQEDRSERLFETSVAAELLRSMLSVNYANTVTDFILAEHPVLHTLCDFK